MSEMPDRALLEAKERDELVQIAEALGIELPPRARKHTIVSAILGPADDEAPEGGLEAGNAGGEGGSVEDAGAAADDGSDARRVTKRTRSPAPQPSGDATAARAERADEADVDADLAVPGRDGGSAQIAEEGNRRSRRRGRGRDEGPIDGETVHCDGQLDLRDEGYGFLRTAGPLPSADDVYVAARQVRQYDLRRGDRITGISRPAARSERNPALLRLDTLNGEVPPDEPTRPHFERLTPVLPAEALRLSGASGASLNQIDERALIGLGSRGLLTAEGAASAAPILGEMAAAVGELHPDVHLMVLLIAARPEDVTELTRRLEMSGEVLASTFDRPVDEHLAVAELTVERTKRMAEAGADVVILFDGATQLARAYAGSANGRHQPADVVGAAITSTLRFFGSARNLEDAGSITMIATARTGGDRSADKAVVARLREAANLEIRRDGPFPSAAALRPGSSWIDESGSFSLGDHR